MSTWKSNQFSFHIKCDVRGILLIFSFGCRKYFKITKTFEGVHLNSGIWSCTFCYQGVKMVWKVIGFNKTALHGTQYAKQWIYWSNSSVIKLYRKMAIVISLRIHPIWRHQTFLCGDILNSKCILTSNSLFVLSKPKFEQQTVNSGHLRDVVFHNHNFHVLNKMHIDKKSKKIYEFSFYSINKWTLIWQNRTGPRAERQRMGALAKVSDRNSFRANQNYSDSFRYLYPSQCESFRTNLKSVL